MTRRTLRETFHGLGALVVGAAARAPYKGHAISGVLWLQVGEFEYGYLKRGTVRRLKFDKDPQRGLCVCVEDCPPGADQWFLRAGTFLTPKDD